MACICLIRAVADGISINSGGTTYVMPLIGTLKGGSPPFLETPINKEKKKWVHVGVPLKKKSPNQKALNPKPEKIGVPVFSGPQP